MKYDWIDEYLLAKKGVHKDFKVEWGWDRYLLKGKMIAAICNDKTGKEIVTLKCDPLYGQELRSTYSDIIPGYYMNKEHWNSVYIGGKVPDEILKKMIDQSYQLILGSLSKKAQKEILDSNG